MFAAAGGADRGYAMTEGQEPRRPMQFENTHPQNAELVASTPRGSTIEAIGGDLYRVCDGSHHCRTVPGLWQAQELAHQAELQHRHPEQLP
ncbi:hypothetical protein LBMAG39_11010 [Cyanobium sp.]|nr:hypothetical protein LBMAG39_11010 [Cyanobium sp.]